ncbi:MAG: hypothetical protein AAFV53_02005 [Myxococcota bacterium]
MPWYAAFFLCCGLNLLSSCSDPPSPAPTPGPDDLPRWSTAPYVRWKGPATSNGRVVALFVEEPDGPLDRIAADADVTSFLNDRFHAIFLTPARAGLSRGVWFISPHGCLLSGPTQPKDAETWIDIGNAVMLSSGQGGQKWRGVPEVKAGSPLQGACEGN